MDVYRCPTARGPIDATVTLPGSKSITNRALVIAALADGDSLLTGALLSDDTRLMIDALDRLGIAMTVDADAGNIEVTGCRGQLPAESADLFCGNAGTTMRLATALCAVGFGEFRLDGTPRMRQRPIGPLVDALRAMGTLVEYRGGEGVPPLTVHARHLTGGHVGIDASRSSQFASAVLLVSPYASRDVMIDVAPPIVSTPYLGLTEAMMDRFGVPVLGGVDTPGGARWVVPAPQRYMGRHYAIEPDASGASTFLAAAALTGGRVTVRGLHREGIQGDAAFATLLERMGCTVCDEPDGLTVRGPSEGTPLTALDADLGNMPDLAPTLGALALFARGPTTLRNVAHLRLKESDRLAALQTELTRLGATVRATPDTLTIEPPETVRPGRLRTYDDHRLAMSFTVCGLAVEGVEIDDPGCCRKSMPDFFARWEAMLAASG